MSGANSGRDASAEELREAIRAARAQHRKGIETVLDVLLRQAGERRGKLIACLRERGGVAVIEDGHEDVSEFGPDFSKWDQASARQSRCTVINSREHRLLLAAEDPWDEVMLQRVARRVGQQVVPAAVTQAALQRWLGVSMAEGPERKDAPPQADGPIVRFVDQALAAALERGASDVHFECDRSGVSVKHRVDGVMNRFARLDDVRRAEEVISRIKVLAQLDITERRLPQDGRFRYQVASAHIDLRVSIMPNVHGEDAVLRLLDKARLRSDAETISLDQLGFRSEDATRIRELAGEPSGMLLVTGPTGSGKTTTVYAAMSEINTGLEKFVTIEDPVEYELPGVLQIPVNDRKGLTFAKGLRSILRHDPDRILVGEIRDAETADIAVQSALTGHLVFTTVHANSVADVVGRFRHFGLDMFGFMSSLNGIVVQRLVRRLCRHCGEVRAAEGHERQWLADRGCDAVATVLRAVGCDHCRRSGYDGRLVVAEVHRIDDGFRDLVTEGAPLSAFRAHARQLGVVSLSEQAARLVATRHTAIEEVRRVIGLG